MQTIFNIHGEVIITIPITENSIRKQVLMAENHVLLSFEYPDYIKFRKGSYIVHDGERFEILTNVYPDRSTKGDGWKYELQFDAHDGVLRLYNIFYRKQGIQEVAFGNTTDILSHGNIIADCINYELGGTNWRVKIVGLENTDQTKLISYKGEKLFDACVMIAETFDCEWWTEKNGDLIDICFGKIDFGTEEDFEVNNVVKSIPRKNGDDSNYGTRFFCFGSTRNLTKDYGQVDQGGIANHISDIRLRLPEGINYIDAWEDMADEDVVHQIAFFEDEYPKNTEVITAIETVQRAIEGSNETFSAYVMIVDGTPFTPDHLIEGETLGCMFESGPLMGREFELSIKETNFDKKFEIIHQEEGYGDVRIIIPNESLHPSAGDKFILTGVRLPNEKIREAEEHLLEVGRSWALKNSRDTGVYDCPTNPVYCAKNDKSYDLGQRVRLVDPRFGLNGRSSRIQGYEKKLANQYDAIYTVGDNTAYSRFGSIESDIKEAQYAERVGVVSGSGIYLIRSKYDSTQPTDYNSYSALSIISRTLSKFNDDTAAGLITFLKGIVTAGFKTDNFFPGPLGAGTGLIGRNELQTDKLLVRKEMTVLEMIVQKMRHQGGQLILSPAGIKISKVEDGGSYWRCYFENENGAIPNEFITDDQARINNYTGADQKYLWARVTSVGDDYVILSKTNKDGNGVPAAGDHLVQLGHPTNTDRQDAVVISSTGGEVGIVTYHGINSFSMSGKEGSWFGKHGGEKGAVVRGKVLLTSGQTVEEYTQEKIGEAVDAIDFGDDLATKTEVSASLEVLNKSIASKVSQTDYNTNNTVVSERFTKIEQTAEGISLKVSSVQSAADTANAISAAAQSAANTAKSTADAAKTAADGANALLADFSDDSKLVPSEKQSVKTEWQIIQSEYSNNTAQATTFGVSSTAYTTAYNALNTYVTPLLASMTATSTIVAATFRSTFQSYYDARTNLLNSIAAKARDLANTAQTDATAAATAAAAAKTASATAQAAIDAMNNDAILDISEKQSIRTQWETINGAANTTAEGTSGSYFTNKTMAATAGVSITSLTSAYTTLRTYLNSVALYTNSNATGFVRTTMATNFKNYYDAEILLIEALAKAKVDNIHIGGVNLLLDYKGAPGSSHSIYNDPIKGPVIQLWGNPTFWYNKLASNIPSGTQVTFSISCRTLSSNYDVFQYFNDSNSYQAVGTATTKWQVLSLTRTINGDLTNSNTIIHLSQGAAVGDFLIEYIQLEIGNMPTAGSSAPADFLATGIDIINKKITATADTFVVRDNAGNVLAVFENGKIKANRIDVENLMARKLLTADSGGRVEITDSIALYGNDGSNVISISRAAIPALTALTGQASQTSATIYGQYADRTAVLTLFSGLAVQKDIATTIRIILPKIITTSISAESNGSFASNRVELRLEGDGINLSIGYGDAYASYYNPNVVHELSVDRTVTVAPVAATTLRLMAYVTCEPNTGQNGSVSINNGTLTTKTTVSGVSYYGNNGLAISMGTEKYLYCAASGNGDTFLTVKGNTDLPGVLAAGRVESGASYGTRWGAKVGTSIGKQGTGWYRVNHNIGHTNYSVTVTPAYSTTPCIAQIYAKATTYVDIYITNYSGTTRDNAFDFMIIGNN